MTRAEKIALCRRLKVDGLTVRAIAEQTGIPRATVGNYLLGDDHTRAVKAARLPACSGCGGGRYSNRAQSQGLCRSCIQSEANRRREQLAALWAAGKSIPEIARALTTTLGAIRVEMAHMRDDGWDLPYRRLGPRRIGKHANLRPEQVAA